MSNISTYDNLIAKLNRADAHLKDIEERINAIGERQYKFSETYDPKTSSYTISFQDTIVIPIELSIIIGEAAYQLRSVLDHLVCGLANIAGHQPARRAQFPIYRRCEDFEKSGKSTINQIPLGAQVRIKRLQPFNDSSPDQHPLSILRELNNADKHHALRVICAIVDDFPGLRIDGIVESIFIAGTQQSVLKSGTPLITIKTSDPKVNVNTNFTAVIAFEKIGAFNIKPVMPLLKRLFDFVSLIIKDFRGDFV